MSSKSNGLRQCNCLYNDYSCKFTIQGQCYSSVSQYLGVCKADFFGEPEVARSMLRTDDVKEIKELEKKIRCEDVELRKLWATLYYDFQKQGVRAKFMQNEGLYIRLLNADARIISEMDKSLQAVLIALRVYTK